MKNLFLFFYNLIEDNFHLLRIKRFLLKQIFLKDPIIFDIGSHRGKLAKLMNEVPFSLLFFKYLYMYNKRY